MPSFSFFFLHLELNSSSEFMMLQTAANLKQDYFKAPY